LHSRREQKNEELESFLSSFKQAASLAKEHAKDEQRAINALQACNKLCADRIAARITLIEGERQEDANALLLLVGIPQRSSTYDRSDLRQASGVIATGGLLARDITSLFWFLPPAGPESKVYEAGRVRFEEALTGSDLLAGTPLERAYAWSIAGKSALDGRLQLGGKWFHIRCRALEGGRIFPGEDANEFSLTDLDKLEEDTLYYALEKDDHPCHPLPTHPRCDLFFKARVDAPDGELTLVMVDVTGGVHDVKSKVTKLNNFCVDFKNQAGDRTNNPKLIQAVRGFVLAPSVVKNMAGTEHVSAICGEKAMALLGGLRQIYHWLQPRQV
jgi:hypothetical protein